MIGRLLDAWRRSKRAREESVNAELAFHLESRTDALEAAGMTRDRARAEARREFGDLDEARRYMTSMDSRTAAAARRRSHMDELALDVRLAWRRLRHSPAFTLTAVATLALGIGANVAIFAIVHAVLLRPLPFPNADRLFAVYSANRTAGQLRSPVSPVDLDDWRAGRQVLEDLGGYFYLDGGTGVDLTGRGAPRRLAAVFVTAGFFSTLGVTPEAGRLPREDELVRGGPDRVVLLSHGFWHREFGEIPAVVGTSVSLGGQPYQVIGALRADMRFPSDATDVYVPYSTIPDSGIPRVRPVRTLNVVARAKAGEPAGRVQAEMNVITARLGAQYPEDRAWDSATVLPLAEVVAGAVRQPLLVLLGAVAGVLLIACVNLAGLQLARASVRRREMSICVALGARRGRLVRQWLTESLLLSAIGGLMGAAVARGAVAVLLALGGRDLPRASEVTLDGTVLAFTALAAVLSGVLFGLLPAWRASSTDLQPALRIGGRTLAGGDGRRLRSALVIAEVALSLVLAVGAGLMVRSFAALVRVDPGFRADHLVAVQFTLSTERATAIVPASPTGTPDLPPYQRIAKEIVDRVRQVPGVLEAAAAKDAPFRGNGERISFRLPGAVVPAGEDPPSATAIHVSDGYFRTIGARIVEGREFTTDDRPGAPLVLVVNEAFGRRFFSGARGAGQAVIAGRDTRVEIVGVVNDIRQVAMAEPAEPTVYIHNLQNGRVKTTVVARTAADPLSMVPAIREAVWSVDPAQPITEVFTFDESVGRAVARPRLLTVLLTAFGAAGLLLGAIGLYGLLVFLLQQQRREIGVRLALGARPSDIRRMYLRRGLSLSAVGIVIGLAAALGLGRLLSSVLFGVRPTDPLTMTAVTTMLLIAAGAASWLPALRASRVDPVETLRTE